MNIKRIISYLTIGSIAFLLAGCSQKNTNSGEQFDDRLVGTKWQTRDVSYEAMYGGDAYNVYEFISTSEVKNYIVKNDNIEKLYGTFQYELAYPKLAIYYVYSDGSIEIRNFIFTEYLYLPNPELVMHNIELPCHKPYSDYYKVE